MTREETAGLIAAGRRAVRDAVGVGAGAVVLGEVGIGNTTASAALLAALCGVSPRAVVDGGARPTRTIDRATLRRKRGIVSRALKAARAGGGMEEGPGGMLRWLGGAEHAAIVGAVLEASDLDVPVIVDGFISTVAALAAAEMHPRVTRVMLLATSSAERGHKIAVGRIQMHAKRCGLPPLPAPALAMGLRLGEGTGGILAVPLLRASVAMVRMGSLADVVGGG